MDVMVRALVLMLAVDSETEDMAVALGWAMEALPQEEDLD